MLNANLTHLEFEYFNVFGAKWKLNTRNFVRYWYNFPKIKTWSQLRPNCKCELVKKHKNGKIATNWSILAKNLIILYEYLNLGRLLMTKTKTAHSAQNGLIWAAHGRTAHGAHCGNLLHRKSQSIKTNFPKLAKKIPQVEHLRFLA